MSSSTSGSCEHGSKAGNCTPTRDHIEKRESLFISGFQETTGSASGARCLVKALSCLLAFVPILNRDSIKLPPKAVVLDCYIYISNPIEGCSFSLIIKLAKKEGFNPIEISFLHSRISSRDASLLLY